MSGMEMRNSEGEIVLVLDQSISKPVTPAPHERISPPTSMTKENSNEFDEYADIKESWDTSHDDPEVVRKLRAVEMSVIFEDLVDALSSVSNGIPAPSVEIRTADSILEDEYYNRPWYAGQLKKLMNFTEPPFPKTDFARAKAKPLLPPIRPGSQLSGDSKTLTPMRTSIISRDLPDASKIPRSPSAHGSDKNVKTQGFPRPRSDQQIQQSQRGSFCKQPGQQLSGLDDGMRSLPTSASQTSSLQRRFSHRLESRTISGTNQQDPSVGSVKHFQVASDSPIADDKRFMDGWLLKQFYTPKIDKRTWQSSKVVPKRSFESLMSRANFKKSNKNRKLQADIANIKCMMSDIFDELVQHGTCDSLDFYLNKEREEMMRLATSYKSLLEKRTYSKKLRAEINNTKMSKMRELEMLRRLEFQIEDESQEVTMRNDMESVYSQNYVEAKIKQSSKMSERGPNRLIREIKILYDWEVIEDIAHNAMCLYLNEKILRDSKLLDYWVEKYETDKERLMADLDDLKSERSKSKEHKKDIEAKIVLWMPIIKDNRRILKIQQDREEYNRKCAYYATKLAARWRGQMVRSGKFYSNQQGTRRN